jgi:hypothetical protein
MQRVRIILSGLWVARMLSSLQGDSVRLSDPAVLRDLVSGTTEMAVTDSVILVLSVIMAVPIVMTFLSLTLNFPAVRVVNLAAGAFFVLFELFFLGFVYIHGPAYEMFWGMAYLAFASLVVWYAWRWPKEEQVQITS